MSAADESIQLHKLIWLDRPEDLEAEVERVKDTVAPDSVNTISELPINRRFRGTTPLCLAIMLRRKQCVDVLLKHQASSLVATTAGFYPLSEAISLGDRSILRDVIVSRQKELRLMVQKRNPELLRSLQTDLRDFYVELKWHFHSWMPFVASLLPNDTCRLWKRGSRVRIDTTLKGFEGYRWRRGDISFLVNVAPNCSSIVVVDHERKVYDHLNQLRDFAQHEIEQAANYYLNNDIVNAKLHKSAKDGSPIDFQAKTRKGSWFGSKRDGEQVEEMVSGYPCRVYDIKNVRWVTKTRHEHLRDRCSGEERAAGDLGDQLSAIKDADDSDKQQAVQGIIEDYKESMQTYAQSVPPPPPPAISFDDYFSADKAGEYVHVGRPMDVKVKEKSMRASVWMADNYPLTLEELVPLLGLIAPTNKQFQKLVDFVESDLPEGFPVQLDIPIFSFLSGVCTFANYTEWHESCAKVPKSVISADPETWFTIPAEYKQATVIQMYEKE